MKTLWTPWRMEHVTGRADRPEGCLFEPPGTAGNDKNSLLLFRDRLTVVLLNRFPYANGHLLVAPRRHVGGIGDLTPEEGQALMTMLRECCRILEEELHPDGFNIGLNLGRVAGAGIDDHLHFHVVPRWEDDHNFMTVLAEIRAIPEHIARTFERLLPAFENLPRTEEDHG
ncbi:MAG: HIT domain-containing protein [Desulfobulbaceae bacterium]